MSQVSQSRILSIFKEDWNLVRFCKKGRRHERDEDILRQTTVSGEIPPEDLLLGAVRLKSISDIQKLMQLNVDINCEGLLGVTPLMEAVVNNDVAMIELLIVYGADVNYHSTNIVAAYPTALIHAAAYDAREAAETLIRHQAEIDLPSKQRGMTALMYAAEKNHADMVELLIEAGADVEAKSYGPGSSKKTALAIAAINGARDVVELLLSKKVNTKVLKKTKHELPRDMRKWLKHTGIL